MNETKNVNYTPISRASAPAPVKSAAPQTVEQSQSFLRDSNISGVAGNLSGFKPARSLPSTLKFTYANSTGATTNLMIFDPIGAVASASGLTVVAPTPNALTNAIIKNYLASNPIIFAGFRMEVTSTTQFNQSAYFYATDYDGSLIKKPIQLETSVTGAKYDETIQYYKTPFAVNSLVGLVFSVLDGQTINLTFSPNMEFLRI